MTAIEAIIFCLGKVSDAPEDGNYRTRSFYDYLGYQHWIEWRMSHGKRAKPRFCSCSDIGPFVQMLEPYRMGE